MSGSDPAILATLSVNLSVFRCISPKYSVAVTSSAAAFLSSLPAISSAFFSASFLSCSAASIFSLYRASISALSLSFSSFSLSLYSFSAFFTAFSVAFLTAAFCSDFIFAYSCRFFSYSASSAVFFSAARLISSSLGDCTATSTGLLSSSLTCLRSSSFSDKRISLLFSLSSSSSDSRLICSHCSLLFSTSFLISDTDIPSRLFSATKSSLSTAHTSVSNCNLVMPSCAFDCKTVPPSFSYVLM